MCLDCISEKASRDFGTNWVVYLTQKGCQAELDMCDCLISVEGLEPFAVPNIEMTYREE